MTGEDDLLATIRELDSDDPRERVLTLEMLTDAPTGSADLLPRLRRLVDDRTPVLVGIPYVFAEVRWVAAHALAAEYRAGGVDEPVVLADVPEPVGIDELGALAEAANLVGGSGHEGRLAEFAALRARGLLPLTTLTL